MKNRTLMITGLLLMVACFAAILIQGRTYTVAVPVCGAVERAEDARVEIEQAAPSVELTGQWLEDDTLYLKFHSVHRGKAYVDVYDPEGEAVQIFNLYVHHLGAITFSSFFGDCTGGRIIPAAIGVYLVLVLWTLIRRYRADVRRSLYQYRNVKSLGLIVYLGGLLLGQISYLFAGGGVERAARSTLDAASAIASFALPIAFLVSVLVTISNIHLLRREGRNWRNMLGFLLGLLVCLTTLFPHVLGEFLQRTTLVDVHNDRGAWQYIEMAVENGVLVAVSYLECILLATILLGVKAARKIPAFDKDYMLILGCQIKKDGTLTKLLKGRADRALEFARMQREATGKELVFVPSGGQGADEVISEAEAIRRYLLETGVPADRILPEDRSVNTEENIRNAAALIRKAAGDREAKIAFATTNYHVFRAGILANRQGVPMEGIGGRTRSYFWINAFIREFIATVYTERKTHIRVILVMLAAVLAMICMVYFSNVL
jgi:vancomycin permeability regulator SanA